MRRREFFALSSMSMTPLAGGSAHGAPGDGRNGRPRGLVARFLYMCVDDFVVDIWHNGKPVDVARRTLLAEIFGATVERVDLEVRQGDWLVFNAVNNRLRWGGASYFGVAGMAAEKEVSFVTEAESGLWTVCDDPAKTGRFMAEAIGPDDKRAAPIAAAWDQGDARLQDLTGGWRGRPVWGESRNTWIKRRCG